MSNQPLPQSQQNKLHSVRAYRLVYALYFYVKEQLSSIEQFTEQISGYAGITELNFKIMDIF
ncbi:MAG: hypothetical protein K2I10_06575 [Lachnospiraceae bacterium]|nr:hypothetical protein [Lachnospiraceae bacterium]